MIYINIKSAFLPQEKKSSGKSIFSNLPFQFLLWNPDVYI